MHPHLPPWRDEALRACHADAYLLAGLGDSPQGAAAWYGLHITPTPRLLALQSWRDAAEGVHEGTPWLSWEIERALRLLLRQSWTALEIAGLALRGHTSCDPAWEPWRQELITLLPGALTRAAPHAALQVAAGLARHDAHHLAARPLLAALHLAAEGALCTQRDALDAWASAQPDPRLRDLAAGAPPDLDWAARRVHDANALPERPPAYDALSDFLVRLRLR